MRCDSPVSFTLFTYDLEDNLKITSSFWHTLKASEHVFCFSNLRNYSYKKLLGEGTWEEQIDKVKKDAHLEPSRTSTLKLFCENS